MKTLIIATALLAISITNGAWAEDAVQPQQEQPAQAADGLDQSISHLQQQWAVIQYQVKDEDQQEKQFASLADEADKITQSNPGKAEPLIWQAIIIGSKAGVDDGLAALSEAKQARALLLAAERINPQALNGSLYTTLGSLYYKVPGWPVGFGDNKLAKEYLEKAMAMNPDGIDANYFYGEFLYETGDYTKAKNVLEHGLKAAPRPGREVADQGRRQDIEELLQKVRQKKS